MNSISVGARGGEEKRIPAEFHLGSITWHGVRTNVCGRCGVATQLQDFTQGGAGWQEREQEKHRWV